MQELSDSIKRQNLKIMGIEKSASQNDRKYIQQNNSRKFLKSQKGMSIQVQETSMTLETRPKQTFPSIL
jgi:hypothetical protein